MSFVRSNRGYNNRNKLNVILGNETRWTNEKENVNLIFEKIGPLHSIGTGRNQGREPVLMYKIIVYGRK